VEHVDADRRHHHPVGERRPQLRQPVAEVEAALAAQFDGVVPGGLGELPLGLEGLTRQQLLLAGELGHGDGMPF
jgi:hypothetical protein